MVRFGDLMPTNTPAREGRIQFRATREEKRILATAAAHEDPRIGWRAGRRSVARPNVVLHNGGPTIPAPHRRSVGPGHFWAVTESNDLARRHDRQTLHHRVPVRITTRT